MRRIFSVRLLVISLLMLGATTLHAQLTADFSPNQTTFTCPPAQLQLTDMSTGGATSWQWTVDWGSIFGGWTSTQQNPNFTLSFVGTFTVTLTVSDGTNTSTTTQTITVNGPTIDQSLLTVSNNFGCAPLEVSVQYAGTWDPTWTYNWDMGDGSTLTSLPDPTNFTHTYTNPGFYGINLTLTDGTGCTTNNWVSDTIIADGGLCVSGTSTDISCGAPNSGTIDLVVNGGTPPYSYIWSNGATTQDLTGLPAGFYEVLVSDNSGITAAATFTITNSDISLSFTEVKADCDSANGSLTVNISGGVPPYSTVWSNGAITPTITGLIPDGYEVTVTDANGCETKEIVFLSAKDSCRVNLSGRVYLDLNQNCTYDPATDVTFSTPIMEFYSHHITYSNNNDGTYNLNVPSGVNLLQLYSGAFGNALPSYFDLTCPPSGVHDLGTQTTDSAGLDFGFFPNDTIQDLYVDGWAGVARPGQVHHIWLYAKNMGASVPNSSLTFTHDPNVTYVSASPLPSTYDPVTRTLTWIPLGILPLQHQQFIVHTLVDTTMLMGDTLCHTTLLSPIAGDVTPANNVDTLCRIVTTSYDPNDKQVEPMGDGRSGNVDISQEWFTFTVRFQNTGNDTAFYVRIRDTIDNDFILTSLDPLGASHPYTLTFTEDRGLQFAFDNILLPDSGTNPEGSQGFVRYRIRKKDGLGIGTTLTNKAAIYFDFNEPVITNTTINTLVQQTNTGISQPELPGLMVYPNPAEDRLTVNSPDVQLTRIQLSDLHGRTLMQVGTPQPEVELDVAHLAPGLYLLQVYHAYGMTTRKVEIK